MKAVTVYGYRDNDKPVWDSFGTLKHEEDHSESYEENEARVYQNDKGLWTLIAANGCSCWDGDWEGWTEVTTEEIKKLGVSWSKDYGHAEKAMGEWIVANV